MTTKIKYRVIQERYGNKTLQVACFNWESKQFIWRDQFSYFETEEFNKYLERWLSDPFFIRILSEGEVEI